MKYRAILTLILLLVFSQRQLLGANWYVDNSLSNSANNGTSWVDAWTNFSSIHWQHNSDASPRVSDGDTLYISGGTSSQVYYDGLPIFGAASQAQAITISPGIDAGRNGTVIFDGNSDAQLATNSNLNNLAIYCQGAFILDGGSSSNFVFRNFYNPNSRLNCEAILGSPTHAVITRFVITNCSNGIKLNPATDVEISRGSFSDMKGDGIITLVAGSQTPDNVRIHHCMIRSDTTLSAGNGPDGIQPDTGTTIYNCTFWNDPNGREFIGQHPDAIQSGGNYLKIYGNIFHNWTGASHSADPPGPTIHDIVYANNIFVYDNTNFIVCTALSSGYNSLITSISNVYWLNNTLVDYGTIGTGIGYEWDKSKASYPTVTNFVVQNNIIFHVGGGGTSGAFLGIGSYNNTNFNLATDITLDHNLTTIGGISGGGTGISTAGNTIFRNQSVPMIGTPFFVNYTYLSKTSNFHLSSNDTAARGQGVNLTALFATLGIPAIDLDGNSRTNVNWDIGAYQSSNGTISPLISPPSDVHTSP